MIVNELNEIIREIDIITRNENYFCFIEVKTRHEIYYGTTTQAVNYNKQDKNVF